LVERLEQILPDTLLQGL